jgi:hypothetical protein
MIYDTRASGSPIRLFFAIICGCHLRSIQLGLRHLKTGSPLGIASATNLTTGSHIWLDDPIYQTTTAPQTSQEWFLLDYRSLFLTAIGYSLLKHGYDGYPPDRALVLALFEPVLNPSGYFL